MADPLQLAARHAKWVLAAGLIAAVVLPKLAQALSGWLVPLIMVVMFLGALRLPADAALRVLRAPGRALRAVLILQLVIPLIVAALLWAGGFTQAPWAIGLLLVLSAPAIVSSPNMAAILKLDGATAMRLVVWGTALVPLTSVPVLLLLFGAADIAGVFGAALRLALVIAIAGGLGFALRASLLRHAHEQTVERLDGASALALAVFVIGLMAELQNTFAASPGLALGWIAFAVAINFVPQVALLSRLPKRADRGEAGAVALISGNRNLALFFAALPPEHTTDLLPFLAAYQFPMYLTPLCLGGLYARQLHAQSVLR